MQSVKPQLYLLLILPVLAGGGIVVVILLLQLFASTRDITLRAVPDTNAFLVALPAFFLWIPISLIVCNLVLQVVPPLRRIAEETAARTTQLTFWQTQVGALKMAAWLGIVCVPLIALGFLIP